MTASLQSTPHIPSLDGVRACAMGIVFIYHAGAPQWVPGRFGVTTFFFLSGFLITTLLRREFEDTGGISLRYFYLRRLLRIFPPMWATIALAALIALIGYVAGFGPAALVAMFLNITNYFMLAGGNVPYELEPLWSLAVEEHFYLLFPAAYLLLLHRGASAKQQTAALVAVAIAVLAWRILLQTGGASYDRLALASDTRMDSLLWGAVLAIAVNPVTNNPVMAHPVARRLIEVRTLPSLMIVGVVGLVLFASFKMVYEPGGSALAISYTVQGLALMPLFYIAIVHHRWPLFRWLDWRPVRHIGTLSYTMYLVHLLVFAVYDRLAPGSHLAIRGVVVFALTVALAHLSYVAMERPLADLRRRLRARTSARDVLLTPRRRPDPLANPPGDG